MDALNTLAIAIALGIDVLTVSASAFVVYRFDEPMFRPMVRMSVHFGLFQAGMMVLGWLAGTTVEPYISAIDHWIAFGLLLLVGGRMIREAFGSEDRQFESDPSRGATLIMLSIATSIDALAVGLSMAVVGQDALWPSLAVGLVSSIMAVIGAGLGLRLGTLLGKRAGLVGGLVLIGIGTRVLVTHLGLVAV
jgi:putative Mn2+ efflux pump MntP